MELVQTSELEFHAIETRTSKAGQPYSVVLLRDTAKFEEFQFFKQDELVLENLKMGDKVTCHFEIQKRGYNINVNLSKMTKVTKVG